MKKLFLFIAAALVSSSMWATDYVGINDTTVHVGSTTNPGAAKKFQKYCDGLYLYRANNGTHSYSAGDGDNKGIKIQNSQSGLVFYIEDAHDVSAVIYYSNSKNYPSVKVKLYSFTETKYDALFKGTVNSTVVDLASTDTVLLNTKSITFTAKGADTVKFANVAAGYYYIYATTSSSDTYFCKIKFKAAAPEATKYIVGVTGNNPCVYGGESATITLSGSQSGVSYQLFKGAAAVEGKIVAGTGSAISFTGIVEAGTYTIKSIKNASYSETTMTGSAVVTLAESPVITTQPTASQKVAIKTALSLSVETSTEDVSYQWYSNTSATTEGAAVLTGKNEATLNIKAASTATTMYYFCVISKDGLCSVASNFAEVITRLGCDTETQATSTITGKTTDTHSGCTTVVNLYNSDGKLGDGSYYEMSLTGGFKAGDVVTVNEKANDYESGKLYMVYGTHDSYTGYQVQDGPTNGNTDNVEFVIPSNMATIAFLRTTTTTDGAKTQNHEIKSVTVTREVCYLDDAPISWILNEAEVTELTIYLDQEYTLPSLSNEQGLEISYESSNESVASFEASVISVSGAGVATITARFAGNATYKATEVSYSLTAIAETPSGINDVENEVKAVKRIVNGQLFIEKNGHVYNVLGGCVK